MDLNQPMDKIREFLGGYSIRTRLSLTGTIVVARDIAHAKLQERIDAGKGLPDYVKDHIIYYAGKRELKKLYDTFPALAEKGGLKWFWCLAFVVSRVRAKYTTGFSIGLG